MKKNTVIIRIVAIAIIICSIARFTPSFAQTKQMHLMRINKKQVNSFSVWLAII